MRWSLSVLAFWLAIGASGETRRSEPSLLSFTMEEKEAGLVKKLGPPEHSSAGASFRTLDYNFHERSDEDFGWTFYFEQPSGNLISITRNFEKPAAVVNSLTGTRIHQHTFINADVTLSATSRLLTGDRVLVAIGVSRPTDLCSQMVLMRRSALANLYPWIDRDLH